MEMVSHGLGRVNNNNNNNNNNSNNNNNNNPQHFLGYYNENNLVV